MSMLTWVVALFRKSTPEMAEDESDGWHTVVSGSVLLPDEAMIPEARQELLRRVFEVAERPVDDDFVYDLKYNEELDAFEMAVVVDVDGGRSGDQATPE